MPFIANVHGLNKASSDNTAPHGAIFVHENALSAFSSTATAVAKLLF